MEVNENPGYTNSDKLDIARRYLVPRQLEANGVPAKKVKFQDAALTWIIEGYTREAGVRSLERQIGAIARAIAAEMVEGKTDRATITREKVTEVLGPRKFDPELASRTSVAGVATGMACCYTPVGGEILFIEATRMPGRGVITLTGQIGEVMKESATAAYSLIRSRAERWGSIQSWSPRATFSIPTFRRARCQRTAPAGGGGDVHGAKLASLMLNRPVHHDVAMTGEITLRGLVLPIGG